MREIFGLRGFGDVDDRGAIEFGLAGELVDRLGHVARAAVMTDISDIAVALMMDDRLVSAARLQVGMAQKRHVLGLGRLLRGGRGGGEQ